MVRLRSHGRQLGLNYLCGLSLRVKSIPAYIPVCRSPFTTRQQTRWHLLGGQVISPITL